ncbi:MAG TPA: efflux RND transporter periplasmic adaptor subunit [Vicinamibacterales bacterium]|jgi:RND family efflux transporter MFP subunit
MTTRLYTAIVIAGIAASGACSSPENTAQASAVTSRPVPVDRVARQDLSRTLELAAEFRPYQEIDLHAKVAGYLKAIHVDVGDKVKKGQLIAELEAPEMMQEAAQADAALKRAEVEVDRARADLQRSEAQERLRRLASDRLAAVVKVRRNLVAQQDIDEAVGRLQDAEAQLSAAKASVAVAEEQVQIATVSKERLDTLLAYLRITAPFDGTITRRLADTGAMIQAGTASSVQARPVVQLSQVDLLRLILPVPESVVPRIRLDAPVEVRVDALKRVFQGRISRFTGKLDAATRTMETEVDLPNADLVIKAGMFGSAAITLEQRQDALTVPVQALTSRTAPIKLLVVGSDQRLQERQIQIGMETPDRVEVVNGLHEGELIVVGARSDLRPGVLVAPKLQTSSIGSER